MPLPSLLIQEVETPLAVTLPISEDIGVVSTPSLEVAPIQNLRVGAVLLLTPCLRLRSQIPVMVGKPRSAYTLITPTLPGENPVDDSNTWIRIHQRRLHHLKLLF